MFGSRQPNLEAVRVIRRRGPGEIYDVIYDSTPVGSVEAVGDRWMVHYQGRGIPDFETGHSGIGWLIQRAEEARVANRARREYRDVVTGGRTRPRPGTMETGTYLMRVRPEAGEPFQVVSVEREDLDPARDVLGVDPRAKPYYRGEAKREAREAKKAAKERERRLKRFEKGKIKGVRSTFSSPKKGAEQIYNANIDFYGPIQEVGDPIDYVDDWFERQEARVRGKWRPLKKTKRGKELYEAHRFEFHRPSTVIETLAYILGKTKSKRWEDVDWRAVEDYNDQLREAYLAEEAHGHGVEGWKGDFDLPLHARGLPTEEEAAKAPAAAREQYIWLEAQKELTDIAERLETAYRKNRKYIKDPAARKTIRERIKDVKAWAEDPAQIPPWACVARQVYCDFPAPWLELAEIEAAKDRPYDPDWPLRELREGKSAHAIGVYPELESVARPAVPAAEDLDLPWERVANQITPVYEVRSEHGHEGIFRDRDAAERYAEQLRGIGARTSIIEHGRAEDVKIAGSRRRLTNRNGHVPKLKRRLLK